MLKLKKNGVTDIFVTRLQICPFSLFNESSVNIEIPDTMISQSMFSLMLNIQKRRQLPSIKY